jgi:hypothetical protein
LATEHETFGAACQVEGMFFFFGVGVAWTLLTSIRMKSSKTSISSSESPSLPTMILPYELQLPTSSVLVSLIQHVIHTPTDITQAAHGSTTLSPKT